jgi:hypothetical protein
MVFMSIEQQFLAIIPEMTKRFPLRLCALAGENFLAWFSQTF